MFKLNKILFLITKGNFGGAQKYVFDLATGLPKDRFEAIVACGSKEGTSLIEKLKAENIKTIELESSEREIKPKNDLVTVKNLIKIIKEEKPNVVHLNSSKIGLLGSLAVLYLKIISFFSNTKHLIPNAIFTSHGWAFNEKNRSFFSKIIFYVGHYLTVLICNKTIAVSEKTKKDISFLPFIKDKITVIYNGIKNFETLPKEESRLILAGEKKDRKIIFSMSELHHNKGLDITLKGLSLLPQKIRDEIVWCIAGDGEEKESLEKMATDFGVSDLVKFLGFIPDSKKLLSGADIFLLPSRTENLPFALLEAGLKSLPIIATRVGGISEVIHDMQNGILIHPHNSKEIAEAIIYLLDHYHKKNEFAKEIKKTVSNFFTFEKTLQETIKIYGI